MDVMGGNATHVINHVVMEVTPTIIAGNHLLVRGEVAEADEAGNVFAGDRAVR